MRGRDVTASELDAGRLGDRRTVDDLEELACLETQLTGEQVVGEDLDLGVELAHAAVVKPARRLDLVFGVDDGLLQLQEVLARLKLGICLGDREQRLQRLLHVPLGDTRFGGALDRDRLGARPRHILEDGLLMRRVSLDRLDEVGKQIGATLELVGDVAPRLIDPDIERDEGVVRRPQIDPRDRQDCDDHDDGDEPLPHVPVLRSTTAAQS